MIRVWLGYSQMCSSFEEPGPEGTPADGDIAVVGCSREAIGADPYYRGRMTPEAIEAAAAWFARKGNLHVFAKEGADMKTGHQWKGELRALFLHPCFEEAWDAAMRGHTEVPVGNKSFVIALIAGMPQYEVVR